MIISLALTKKVTPDALYFTIFFIFWLYNHSKSLLGSADKNQSIGDIDPIFPNVKIADTAFTLDEAVEARKQVKEDKAPGEDEIMPEVLKRINIDDIILHFANKMLLENKTPEQFSTLNILPIPRSGDLSITANYRGIALTPLFTKVINRMILNRIRPITCQNYDEIRAACALRDLQPSNC